MKNKEKGRKWDGKSRVSTDKYRKRFNEINWKDEWQICLNLKWKIYLPLER